MNKKLVKRFHFGICLMIKNTLLAISSTPRVGQLVYDKTTLSEKYHAQNIINFIRFYWSLYSRWYGM